ncbi:NnrU family protein [Paeniroseomonas aquatica]|uniref:NnrU family protein n=1 Tax=Paeniroseomonas aquatica TaxID=373043 RepID=A0ABT8AG85_9PROT|nr:NnrU family protein [Paeniroseomonas aquatica]MDN3568543.1 NnrU family protein [Paeniroseomonas aquatica]
MTGWGEYVAAWAVFLLTHAVPVQRPVKLWLVECLGHASFWLTYSLLSIVVLAWMIEAAARAPFVELWPRAEWQNHVTLTTMALACLILSLAVFRPNPFSFGGWRNDDFDPERPGIVGLVRHPVLAALALWALGHLAPNGDIAHVVMFGGFLAFSVFGMAMIDRRHQHSMGSELWQRLRPRRIPHDIANPVRWLAAAMALAGLIVLHPLVIGLPAVW